MLRALQEDQTTAPMTRNPVINALVLLTIGLTLGLCACSEVTESADDCSSDEFFDKAGQLCRVCPALEVPECPVGCGVLVGQDASGCATAECQCDVCADGQFYDADRLECLACPDLSEGSCGEGCVPAGTTLNEDGCESLACDCDGPCARGGVCGDCPATDCGDEVCGCEPSYTGSLDEAGCGVFACECPDEIPETHEIGDDGACRLRAE
jgi:hypothetical protein